MTGYHIYAFDSGGHITKRIDAYYPDDGAVLEAAREMLPNERYEVWDGARPVRHLQAVSDRLHAVEA